MHDSESPLPLHALDPAAQPVAGHPPLVRFLVKHAVMGFTAAGLFVATMLYFNVGNLMALVSGSDVGVLAVAMLTLMTGLTFASVQMGLAVMFGSDGIGSPPRRATDSLRSVQELAPGALRAVPVRARRG